MVWGTGPLSEQVHSTVEAQTRKLTAEQRMLRDRVRELEAESRVGEDFVRTVAEPLAAKQLTDRRVTIFVAPGADPRLVTRIQKALDAAGANVTSSISLTADYLDPTKAVSPLEDLALRLVPPRVTFPSGAKPIDRVSTVLARSTVTSVPDQVGQVDDKGAEALAGFEEIGALKIKGESGTLSELAVLVVGPSATPAEPPASSATDALAGLADALDRSARGLVVIGPPAAAGPNGLIAALRAAPKGATVNKVSTVDIGNASPGPLAVVLALAQNLRGESGHYGVGPRAAELLPPVQPPAVAPSANP